MIKVLFVCLGNICRSPTAHGIFQQLVDEAGLSQQIHVDSADTMGYHAGSEPDLRSQRTALDRGVDLGSQRSRQVTTQDFEDFDYILAMDSENLSNLNTMHSKQPQFSVTLSLLLNYSANYRGRDVPDPYYGGPRGFEDVFEMVEDGCRGLLAAIQTQLH